MINKCMNYNKHYNLLIERAKMRKVKGYSERHHIVPRCMGGTDHPDNLVDLLPEEHYLAHQLLIKMYPNESALVYAALMMTVGGNTHSRNNKRYGWIRRRYLSECKKRIGSKNPSFGKSWYHDPNTNKSGKFLPSEVPDKWIKGRVPTTENRYCKSCGTFVDVAARGSRTVLCEEHRYDYKVNLRKNQWHTPVGVFDTPH